MLNFNKKKYVSFDNLSKFSGMIQKALNDKFKNVETNLNEKIDSRFKSLTAKEQGDSEVIDAREGQVSLSENLKTYVKKEEHENLDNKVSNQIEEMKPNVNANTEYINTNKSAIQRVIDFVNSFIVTINVQENSGCMKFPSMFGGFKIQWGKVYTTTSSTGFTWDVVTFPEPYVNDVFLTHIGNIHCEGKDASAFNGMTDTPTGSNFIATVQALEATDDVVNKNISYRWIAFGY